MESVEILSKNRGGRPTLDIENSRCVPVYFRFTPSEMALINKRAGNVGLTRAEFCRAACLYRPVRSVPQINKEAYSQLANVANNLNQLTKLAHETQNSSVAVEAIEQVLESVRVLRAELIEVRDDTAQH